MSSELQVYDSDVKQTPIISQVKGVWEKRGLLKLLVSRDLTVRYKRSVIGIWWSLLNPLFTTAVMFWVFNTVFKARMPDGTAFLPYLLSGVLVMTLFNQGLTMAADSIATGAGVLTKVYVRPEIFALSATISSAINFLFGLIPLTLVLAISHKLPGWGFPLTLIVIGCMTLFTTGLGLMLAIAYVNFDDSRSLIQIMLLALQYMTPVFYPLSVLGPHTRIVIEANPLTSYVSVFRDVFGNNYVASLNNWLMMGISSLVMFGLGFYVFQRAWPRVVAKI
jgi:ABC-type polysaccharide/polyol phosphate export permease